MKPTSAASAAAFASAFAKAFEFAIEFQLWRPSTSSAQQLATLEMLVPLSPFVVGPAVERKIGLSAMSTLAINANKWFDADWALQKGLYAEIFDNNDEMDLAIKKLSNDLSTYSLEAMKKLKKTFWEGTDHWDDLLNKRAEISGSLILSDFSKETIHKIQNK